MNNDVGETAKMAAASGQPYYTAVESSLADLVLNGGLPTTSFFIDRAGVGARRALEDYYAVDIGTLIATTLEGIRSLAELINETVPEGEELFNFSILKLSLPEGWPMYPAPADGILITTLDIPANLITWVMDIEGG